jgi:hypothetical protein
MFCQVFTLCICENSQFVKKATLIKRDKITAKKRKIQRRPIPALDFEAVFSQKGRRGWAALS